MLTRNLFLATAVVTLTAGEGLAVDLPQLVTKVRVPLPTKSWRGCY
jgi:hypothetical protein